MKHKYQIVSASIEHKINTDLYKDKLPTEDELIVEYGVSRNTIRKAIQILVQKGIIIPIQGSG
ncbi:MAG: GntR family transcriptional regulator, partial [Erysipelothrix sp.]|nr:GntR family transcriptional regulator [Erysipelothrix sp.]